MKPFGPPQLRLSKPSLKNGELEGIRTLDPMIKSHVLYQLSYELADPAFARCVQCDLWIACRFLRRNTKMRLCLKKVTQSERKQNKYPYGKFYTLVPR
jgi:hypothetical protein